LRKSQQPKAKRALQEIWMADAKADAEPAFDAFIQRYRVKYAKAAECLNKDRDALVTSYDFPAGHWKHLRTTNPLESTFTTVKGYLSKRTALAVIFKLETAHKKLVTPRRQQPIAKAEYSV
jgi:transposase-like protein